MQQRCYCPHFSAVHAVGIFGCIGRQTPLVFYTMLYDLGAAIWLNFNMACLAKPDTRPPGLHHRVSVINSRHRTQLCSRRHVRGSRHSAGPDLGLEIFCGNTPERSNDQLTALCDYQGLKTHIASVASRFVHDLRKYWAARQQKE